MNVSRLLYVRKCIAKLTCETGRRCHERAVVRFCFDRVFEHSEPSVLISGQVQAAVNAGKACFDCGAEPSGRVYRHSNVKDAIICDYETLQ